jgi:hypothetical protein
MNMNRQINFFMLLILVSLFFMLFPFKAQMATSQGEVTCEDGEKFIIQEKGIIETTHLPGPKDDLIIIDVKKLKLNFYREGRILRTYPVAVGELETPTPIGEWKIIHKGGNWGNGFGDRWIGINVPWGIYGIHGTNKPWSIGTRSSHGCVRMLNKHILDLYGLVKLGTPVHIIGDLPKVSPRSEVGRNNTGRDIIAFQFALRKAGFEPGTIDGRFGAEMEQAVYRLQFYYGFAPTGRISLNEQIILGFR